ncbi:MAG: hypothetical protein KZQ76_01095 [Candidatus Thiodiazotropha sp. (ex Epidulcina cf. delphinae)]|nr:hypothetical protein [Candidatus Thiodiazotropha sp. (ex Epidulcina cf. delphinae)]
MKAEISQLLKTSGAVSVNPFEDQIAGFFIEFDALRTRLLKLGLANIAGALARMDAFSAQLTAWDTHLTDLASPRRLVEVKVTIRAMAEFIEEPDGCAGHVAFFDDLLGAGDVITARISEALSEMSLAIDQGAQAIESALQTIDQLTADLVERVQWITNQITKLLDFETRLAAALAMVTTAADPCMRAIIERTAPPDVAAILNIT